MILLCNAAVITEIRVFIAMYKFSAVTTLTVTRLIAKKLLQFYTFITNALRKTVTNCNATRESPLPLGKRQENGALRILLRSDDGRNTIHD